MHVSVYIYMCIYIIHIAYYIYSISIHIYIYIYTVYTYIFSGNTGPTRRVLHHFLGIGHLDLHVLQHVPVLPNDTILRRSPDGTIPNITASINRYEPSNFGPFT